MTDVSWDIDHNAVYGKYTASAELVEAFNGEITEFSDHFAVVQDALGDLSVGEEQLAGLVVAHALVEFGEYAVDRLAYIQQRRDACWSGAVEATHAYVSGDLDMAAEAQRQDLWLGADSPLLDDHRPR
jgi:hypothetical protein